MSESNVDHDGPSVVETGITSTLNDEKEMELKEGPVILTIEDNQNELLDDTLNKLHNNIEHPKSGDDDGMNELTANVEKLSVCENIISDKKLPIPVGRGPPGRPTYYVDVYGNVLNHLNNKWTDPMGQSSFVPTAGPVPEVDIRKRCLDEESSHVNVKGLRPSGDHINLVNNHNINFFQNQQENHNLVDLPQRVDRPGPLTSDQYRDVPLSSTDLTDTEKQKQEFKDVQKQYPASQPLPENGEYSLNEQFEDADYVVNVLDKIPRTTCTESMLPSSAANPLVIHQQPQTVSTTPHLSSNAHFVQSAAQNTRQIFIFSTSQNSILSAPIQKERYILPKPNQPYKQNGKDIFKYLSLEISFK